MVSDALKLAHIFDLLKTSIFVLDERFSILSVNDAGLAILETGNSQTKERPFDDFFVDDGFDKQKFKQAFGNKEDFTETEVQLCFKDGRCLLTDITVTFVLDTDAPLMVMEIRQVDKQKKISQETQQHAQQQAAKELVRGLAHEIKNPLGGIRGAAQLLEKELFTDHQKEFTQMIIEQSDRLRALVDRLLGPNSVPHKKWQNIHQVIEKVRSLIDVDVTHQISIAIERDYDPSLPDVFIDADMLQQVLLNIAQNSMQALVTANTVDSLITFRTRIERQTVIQQKQYPICLVISIIDNGPGIPTALKDTLFYPMVTSKSHGSGLGLSIAQTLTEHHGGKIDVESFIGHTEFKIYLPIIKRA